MDGTEGQEWNSEKEVLKYLIECDLLPGAAKGITLQAIDKGKDSLSPKQQEVFKEFVQDKYLNLKCRRCSEEPIPTSEIIEALDDGLCSWCRKMEENDD